MQFCCKTNELQYCAYSVYMFHAGISEKKVSMLLNKLNISFINRIKTDLVQFMNHFTLKF